MNIKHLTKLARVKLTPKEQKKLEKDLNKILKYFEELKKVNTEGIEPVDGGHSLINILREDEVDFSDKAQCADEVGRIIELFSDTEQGYLKVPKILSK